MNTINMTSFLYLYMYIYSCPYINSIHVIIKPWGDISRLTDSRTSRKSSLRRYLIPSLLQPICPVTCDVIWLVSSLLYWKQNRLLQWRNSKKITAGSIKLPLFEHVPFYTWDLTPCCVMKVFSMPVSVFCGYPKSKISIKANKSTNNNHSL